MESGVLQSWKEIATYLGRGVRTVQRWEAFGLPVRRPSGRNRSAVLAMKDEVDQWLRGCARHELPGVFEGENRIFLERRTGGDRRRAAARKAERVEIRPLSRAADSQSAA